LDIRFKEAVDPVAMEAAINNIPGVVENGFFTGPSGNPLCPVIFIGHENGTVERRDMF
jgi:ribose 5-phosphate isomerase